MKILAIRGKNLASLAGEFEVDFEQEPLKSTGLFAISGATGAGKSTLLDALCMALFERTPRLFKAGAQTLPDVGEHSVTQQDARNLLRRGTSDGYAEVDFIGTDALAYRARWSVRRARGKADGSLQKTAMTLKQLPDLQPLGGTNKEVLGEITQRLGLSFEQFTRAVLLAQNEFSTFLKSDDSERGALLETLTGSTIYSTLSQRAHARATLERQEKERIEARFADHKPLSDEALAQLSQDSHAAQATVTALEAQKTTLEAQLRWFTDDQTLHTRIAQAQQAQVQQQANQDAAAPRMAQLRQVEAVQTARPLAAEVQRVDAALAQADALVVQNQSHLAHTAYNSGKAAVSKLHKHEQLQKQEQLQAQASPQLDTARALDTRIATLTPLHQAVSQARGEAHAVAQTAQSNLATLEADRHTTQARQTTVAAWLSTHATLQALADPWPRWDVLFKQAHSLQNDTRRHNATLACLTPQVSHHEQGVKTAMAALTAAQTAVSTAQNAHQQAQNAHIRIDIDALHTHKATLEARRDQLKRAQQLWTQQQAEQQRLNELLAALHAHQQAAHQAQTAADTARAQSPALSAALTQAERSLKTAEAACADSVESLRDALQDGAQCPVCGATAHPYTQHAPPFRAMLDGLHAEVSRCRAAQQQAENAHTRHSTEAHTHRQQAQATQAQISPLQTSVDSHPQAWHNHPLRHELNAIQKEAHYAYFTSESGQNEAQLALATTAQTQWHATLAAVTAAQAQLDRRTQAHHHAKEAVTTAQTALNSTLADQHTATEQRDHSQHQLDTRLHALAAAFPDAEEADGTAPWRDAWQADPQAFHAQCERNVQQWQAQHSAREQGQQQLEKLTLALRSAQTQCDHAHAELLRAHTAFEASAATLQALHSERQALFDGQAVSAVVHALAQAVSTAKTQYEQQAQAHSEAQQTLARSTEALAQAQAQQHRLEREASAAHAALQDWLLTYNRMNRVETGETLERGQREDSGLTLAEPFTALVDTATLTALLAHPSAWLIRERAHVDTLAAAVRHAATVLQERQHQREAHQQTRPAIADIDAGHAALSQLSTALDAALAQSTQRQLDLAKDLDRRTQSAELLATLAQQEATYRVWAQLNELIGSESGKKFRNYAQQTTLDLLLAYANRHLHELSRRYRLQRIPDTLALMVIDQDMGDEQRSVHSLSGGESFLVSLALALGLASLSSNRVKVESLFIDEGFGSLDADTLRVAMDALDGLQSLGRKVGVISHVQEMTERIAVKIAVQRTAGGRSVVKVG